MITGYDEQGNKYFNDYEYNSCDNKYNTYINSIDKKIIKEITKEITDKGLDIEDDNIYRELFRDSKQFKKIKKYIFQHRCIDVNLVMAGLGTPPDYIYSERINSCMYRSLVHYLCRARDLHSKGIYIYLGRSIRVSFFDLILGDELGDDVIISLLSKAESMNISLLSEAESMNNCIRDYFKENVKKQEKEIKAFLFYILNLTMVYYYSKYNACTLDLIQNIKNKIEKRNNMNKTKSAMKI